MVEQLTDAVADEAGEAVVGSAELLAAATTAGT
jgi:hypothetical protein